MWPTGGKGGGVKTSLSHLAGSSKTIHNYNQVTTQTTKHSLKTTNTGKPKTKPHKTKAWLRSAFTHPTRK